MFLFSWVLPPANRKNCNQIGPVNLLETDTMAIHFHRGFLALDRVFPLARPYVLIGWIGDVTVPVEHEGVWKCQILLSNSSRNVYPERLGRPRQGHPQVNPLLLVRF